MNSFFDTEQCFQQGVERLVRYAKGTPIKVECTYTTPTISTSNKRLVRISALEAGIDVTRYVGGTSRNLIRAQMNEIKDNYLKPYKKLRRLPPEQLVLFTDSPEPHIARIARYLVKEAK
jgi:hypothetical protein